ncbi:MAG: hypothetical protein RLZ98_2284 [Pseudomonadota bacterium]
MSDDRVVLRDVTADNWEEVVELELAPEQRDFVASNAYSLAESKFNPYAVPKAIYAGKKLVGFLMFESLGDEDRPHDYFIYRFMVDRRHQARGYGRAAMKLLLEELDKDARLRRIRICYVPANEVSRSFYASFGFRETGQDEDGEMQAEIRRR